MYAAAILFLILVAIFGRNVFRAIWWIFIAGILAIIGLAWIGSMLPDQPKPKAAAAVTPTTAPKLEEPATSTPAPTATPKLLEYGFDEKENSQGG
jgi:hypothetical protein